MKFFEIVFYICTNNHGWIGEAITGTASIAGDLISGKSSREAQEEANKLTRELYYADREYNKPINQVARLREAGLNPNLVYGGSGSIAGNTSKGAPKMESIGGYDVDFAGAVSAALTLSAIEQKDKENKNLDQTNQNLKETQEEIKERVKGIKLDNDLKEHDLEVVKGSPTTSKDHGLGTQIVRGANYIGKQIAKKSNSSDFVRGASNLIIPQVMRDNKKVGNVDVRPKSSKPWFVRMQGKPWFVKSR